MSESVGYLSTVDPSAPRPLPDLLPGVWADVSHRTPAIGDRCLVHAPRDGQHWPELMVLATWTTFGWWPLPPERQDGVTHWMLAPAPPKAGPVG